MAPRTSSGSKSSAEKPVRIAGMRFPRPLPLPAFAVPPRPASAQRGNEAMQRLGRRLAVLHQGHADIAGAGVEAGGLAADVASGQHAQAGLTPEPDRDRLAVAKGP